MATGWESRKTEVVRKVWKTAEAVLVLYRNMAWLSYFRDVARCGGVGAPSLNETQEYQNDIQDMRRNSVGLFMSGRKWCISFRCADFNQKTKGKYHGESWTTR